MSFRPVTLMTVSYEPEEGRRLRVGRLAVRQREILFEYDPGFLESGLELSPLHLPLRAGVFTGDPGKFDGLMGVFDDSLPDGWGRLLIDRRAAKLGIGAATLTPLDRLSLIGGRAMGALVYEPEVALEPPTVVNLPELEADATAVLREARGSDLDRLIALGGSPHGARPKVLVQVTKSGDVVYGDSHTRPGCEHYLVKFRALQDELHAGTLEHAYVLTARAAGLEVPESMMLGRTKRHPGYFASRRFDRDRARRRHLHTLAGLLQAPPRYASVTYRDLLIATRTLTKNEAAVAQMFRLACFNVFAHNRDDHARNFAFLMDERGEWRASPAYDLTYSEGPGGEHTLLVHDEGARPDQQHLRALAKSVSLRDAGPIIEKVRSTVRRFPRFADEAGVPKRARDRIAKALGIN